MLTKNDIEHVPRHKTQWRRDIKAGHRERTLPPGIVVQAYESGDVQTWVDLIRSRAHWQDSCWLWMGEFDGRTSWITVGVARKRVRRTTAEKMGLIDHTKRIVSRCKVYRCVNPDHFEVQVLRRYAIDDIESGSSSPASA